MPPITGRASPQREKAAAKVAEGTWDGTQELIEAVAAESRYTPAWRPLRAALVCAVRDLEAKVGEKVWSGERFSAWEKEAKLLCKARGDGELRERIGLTKIVWRKARHEGVTKAVALACLHYSLGMPLPTPADDPRAFSDWFYPRFGGYDRPSVWLGISKDWLGDRLRGYELVGDERRDRTPPAWLIRALDWLFTVGPVAPFDRPFVPFWPEQSLDDDY